MKQIGLAAVFSTEQWDEGIARYQASLAAIIAGTTKTEGGMANLAKQLDQGSKSTVNLADAFERTSLSSVNLADGFGKVELIENRLKVAELEHQRRFNDCPRRKRI